MRKVMIVDDESLVRVGFQTIIDWETHGYQISGLYKNGLQAWEAVQAEGPPDVLLTDIKMPEMDGLELIKKIREQYADCNIIILSSHDEFDYLRSSIQLRVQDYILKHTFEPDELIHTLNNLHYKAAIKTRENIVQTENIEAEKQLLLQESRVDSTFFTKKKGIGTDRYPALVKSLGTNDAHGYWISVRPYPKENPYLHSEVKALNYQMQDLINRFSSIVYFGMCEQTIHAFYKINRESDLLNESVFGQWITSVLQKLDIQIVVGISGKHSLSQEMIKMRMQAETAINQSFYSGAGVYLFDKEELTERISVLEWAKLKERALELLQDSTMESIFDWMNHAGERFAETFVHQEEAIQFLRMVYRSFLEHVLNIQTLRQEDVNAEIYSSLIAYEDATANSTPVWREILKTTCEIMEAKNKTFQMKRKSPWLETVIDYIQEHYTEPIRLEDVARLANFNENYFSLLFRNEMGITFLDYVTRLRIEKAMELLKDRRLSTEEVSFQVGYPNGNYFVKVFKKVTGMTISQYRSNPHALIKNMENPTID